MGKQNRVISQKTKAKQQLNIKKPKAVKTNLKRLNEHVRDKIEQLDKLYDKQSKKQEQLETIKQDNQLATSSKDNK